MFYTIIINNRFTNIQIYVELEILASRVNKTRDRSEMASSIKWSLQISVRLEL